MTELCQRINLKLVEILQKQGAERAAAENASAKGKVRYHEVIFELLQDAGLGGLAAGRASRAGGLESCAGHRLGVATLVQVLWLEMEDAMQKRAGGVA